MTTLREAFHKTVLANPQGPLPDGRLLVRVSPQTGGSVVPGLLKRALCFLACGGALAGHVLSVGCQSAKTNGASVARTSAVVEPRIKSVACLYEKRPWLNLDAAGDKDPEGIRFRVFLDTGNGRGMLADGTFHIHLYVLERNENGELVRKLASDWHYPSTALPVIAKPGRLGPGYFPHLRWASKEIAGHEVEIVTAFESKDGYVVRSQTKGFRVPKYTP